VNYHNAFNKMILQPSTRCWYSNKSNENTEAHPISACMAAFSNKLLIQQQK